VATVTAGDQGLNAARLRPWIIERLSRPDGLAYLDAITEWGAAGRRGGCCCGRLRVRRGRWLPVFLVSLSDPHVGESASTALSRPRRRRDDYLNKPSTVTNCSLRGCARCFAGQLPGRRPACPLAAPPPCCGPIDRAMVPSLAHGPGEEIPSFVHPKHCFSRRRCYPLLDYLNHTSTGRSWIRRRDRPCSRVSCGTSTSRSGTRAVDNRIAGKLPPPCSVDDPQPRPEWIATIPRSATVRGARVDDPRLTVAGAGHPGCGGSLPLSAGVSSVWPARMVRRRAEKQEPAGQASTTLIMPSLPVPAAGLAVGKSGVLAAVALNAPTGPAILRGRVRRRWVPRRGRGRVEEPTQEPGGVAVAF